MELPARDSAQTPIPQQWVIDQALGRRRRDITKIICSNDPLAFDMMSALCKHGRGQQMMDAALEFQKQTLCEMRMKSNEYRRSTETLARAKAKRAREDESDEVQILSGPSTPSDSGDAFGGRKNSSRKKKQQVKSPYERKDAKKTHDMTPPMIPTTGTAVQMTRAHATAEAQRPTQSDEPKDSAVRSLQLLPCSQKELAVELDRYMSASIASPITTLARESSSGISPLQESAQASGAASLASINNESVTPALESPEPSTTIAKRLEPWLIDAMAEWETRFGAAQGGQSVQQGVIASQDVQAGLNWCTSQPQDAADMLPPATCQIDIPNSTGLQEFHRGMINLDQVYGAGIDTSLLHGIDAPLTAGDDPVQLDDWFEQLIARAPPTNHSPTEVQGL